MKGNKILYVGIAIFVLGISFAIGTYAYYQNTITGTAAGTVLAWNCTANGETANFTISLGSLHPGSSGAENIVISSSIEAYYSITFDFGSTPTIGAGSVHPNLNLYRDSLHTSIINDSDTIPAGSQGVINANSSVTETIYYYWPYGTAAENYNATPPSVTVTVTCTQR